MASIPSPMTVLRGLVVLFSSAPDAADRVEKATERWRERARSRRALSELDEHLLRDIGLDRTDVDDEARKPFWRS